MLSCRNATLAVSIVRCTALPHPNQRLFSSQPPRQTEQAARSLLREFSLQDKVFAVTGAARGLGLEMSDALIEAGAKVVALDRLPPGEQDPDFIGAQEKAKELQSVLEYMQIDVTKEKKVADVFRSIVQKHGRLDGLIAAAGINREIPALEYNADIFREALEINITGVFITAQAAAKEIIAGGKPGSIVLIGSMSGTVANKGLLCTAYNTSKAGVVQMARNLAAEWGKYNIRVNTISPGYIETKMTASLFETHPQRRTEWSEQSMLGRVSKPSEYRGVAVFLASDASSYATGSNLIIDGGHSSW